MIWIMVLILLIAIGPLPLAILLIAVALIATTTVPEMFSVPKPAFVAIGSSIANPGLNPAPGPERSLSCPQPFPSGFT